MPKKLPIILENGKRSQLPEGEKIKGSGFSIRCVEENEFICDNEEMIISDCIEIKEDGCLNVDGILTILGE